MRRFLDVFVSIAYGLGAIVLLFIPAVLLMQVSEWLLRKVGPVPGWLALLNGLYWLWIIGSELRGRDKPHE